jgi:biopolymer transport protein ExbB/TolQ
LNALALVIFGFFALLFATLFWVAWAAMWLVVVLFWLAWPLTLLVVAAIAWRAQARYWRRVDQTSTVVGSTARTPAPRAETQPSENRAFEEYRAETLRRLDEERAKFGEYLERLRKSKDREAFDSFIAERRTRLSADETRGAIA